MIELHKEIAGHEVLPVEEIKIEEEITDKKKKQRKKRNME
jgi:hypothetical protein